MRRRVRSSSIPRTEASPRSNSRLSRRSVSSAPSRAGRVEARLESLEEAARDGGIQSERELAARRARHGADPERVAGVGPQDRDLLPRESGRHDEFVQPVVLRAPRVDGPQRVRDPVLRRLDVQVVVPSRLGLEDLDLGGERLRADRGRRARGVGRLFQFDGEAGRIEDSESQILERRDHVAEHELAPLGEHAELVVAARPGGRPPEQQLCLASLRQPREPAHVLDGRVDVHRRLVPRRELHEMRRQVVAAGGAVSGHEGVLETLLPRAHDRAHLRLDRLEVDRARFVRIVLQVEVQPRLVALAEGEVIVEQPALIRLDERRLELPPDLPGEMGLGQDDHDLHAAAELVRARGDPNVVRAPRWSSPRR